MYEESIARESDSVFNRRDIRRDAPRCAEMLPSLCQVRKCAERCLTALAETSDIRPRVKQTVRAFG